MSKKNADQRGDEDMAVFNRRFRSALIFFAVVEFIVLMFGFYYKARR